MTFEEWKDDYGLVYEPNYSEATEADCRSAWSARDAEVAELKGHLEYALKAKRECYGERDQLHERVSALKTPPQLRQDLHCVASDLAQQVREAEQERDQLRDQVKLLQESSYAGVLMWIGERRIKQVITETEITHERISGQTITNAAQYCLEAIAATEPRSTK